MNRQMKVPQKSASHIQKVARLCAVVAPMVVVLALLVGGAAIPAYAQAPSLVYSFDAVDNGIFGPFPASVMTQGQDGNLYGTTDSGGVNLVGGVFVVTPSGSESVLHVFSDAEGRHCNMGLTLGADGNFYGACYDGGTTNHGTVYQLTPSGVLTILHSFSNSGSDGAAPNAPPIQAKDGNFYGTTIGGGTNGDGTIYKLTPKGAFTTIHSFIYPAEGGSPGAQLVQGSNGNFYGTTEEGGGIFKVTSAGKLTVIHALATSDGEVPLGALIQGTNGNYYGTTSLGGANGEGTVFKTTAAGKFKVLYNFNSEVDGQAEPWIGLVQAGDGNYYGVTFRFGRTGQNQYGGIYRLTPKGVYSSLYLFDGSVGANPASALIQHTSGLLYGNTQNNGGFDVGTIYCLDVGAAPFCNLQTTSGSVGASLGILGQGFSTSSVVEFGGVPALSINLTGTTYIAATVPPGALTGSVTVTTGATTLTCKQTFNVTPTLTTFSPTSGPVGTAVTIAGTGLTQASKVTFNKVVASFTVDSDNQITTAVPAGATTGKIAVTTKGGSVTSKKKFTVN